MSKAQAPNASSNNNLYPQEFQLKLYQAFIFSIPILFSMMLFLLFYLFHLKKRASDLSPPPHPTALNQDFTLTPSPLQEEDIKEDLKDKLIVVQFDEELRAKDSQCCVCLVEFELKQELRQVRYCKHVFHTDCIRGWLEKNATCPLCRCHVITSAVLRPRHQEGSVDDDIGNYLDQGPVVGDLPRDEHVLHIEIEPSSTVGPDVP